MDHDMPLAVEAPVSVWTFLNVPLRHRVAMLVLPLAFAAFGASMALTSPRKYVASASFAPEEVSGGSSALGQLAAQLGVGSASSSAGSPTFYADLLKTRGILKRVVSAPYNVTQGRVFSGNLIEFYDLSSPDSAAAIRSAVLALLGDLTVSTDRTTNVVRAEVRTVNPGISLQIVNRLLESVNEYNAERRRARVTAELDFVEQQLAHAEGALATAERRLADFQRRNRQIMHSPDLLAEETALQRRVAQRQEVFMGLAQGHEASKIEAARSSPFITIIDRPEGFVEAVSKGTLRNTLLGALVGFFFAIIYAFLAEYFAAARRTASPDYREFNELIRRPTLRPPKSAASRT